MKFTTERLMLRDLTLEDLDDLHEILSDPESMKHYPRPFTRAETENWIRRNQERYATDGFGLWGVVRKEDGQVIGDCGITMQNINGSLEPEIGYHINKRHSRQGYATEAARACRDYAFEHLNLSVIYSYMKYTNIPSQRVAEKNGMQLIMTLEDEKNDFTTVYAITREEYRNMVKQ